MRQIVLDTETTGLRPGVDKIVEIACVEVQNYYPTGRVWHTYVNPGIKMPKAAEAIHGITDKKLKGKPKWWQVEEAFLSFLGSDPIVAHNASFDVAFIKAELTGQALSNDIVDTLALYKQAFPLAPASLDAVAQRFGVNVDRSKHGALIDAKLLAQLYVDIVGRQHAFDIATAPRSTLVLDYKAKPRQQPLPPRISEEELARHRALFSNEWKGFV